MGKPADHPKASPGASEQRLSHFEETLPGAERLRCALKANTESVPKLTLPHSLDWLNRENVQEPSIFHGKNHGLLMFPVDFPLNQVIDKSESKTHWRSTCKARLSSSSAAKSLPEYEGHGELFLTQYALHRLAVSIVLYLYHFISYYINYPPAI